MTGSTGKEVARELLPFVRVFKDGAVERLSGSPLVPESFEGPESGVLSKDITISRDPSISARFHLPKLTEPREKLPILVYFHGGGFCVESAFSLAETKFMKSLVSLAKVVAVSVEYRLAPEHPLPTAYEDCWASLQWVASQSVANGADKEQWLLNHGDFGRVFLGGDSAGANIVHNIAMKAGNEALPGGVKLLGAFLTHPYFWGSKPIGSESSAERESCLQNRVWSFIYPSAPGGIDNPMINPLGPEAPSLAGIGCSRLLVTVAGLDEMKDRGITYSKEVKDSGWKGEVELVQVEGEHHTFHILDFGTDNSTKLIKRLASFLLK